MTFTQVDDEMARGQPVYRAMVFGREFLKEADARETIEGSCGAQGTIKEKKQATGMQRKTCAPGKA